jgi:hypothetical protein
MAQLRTFFVILALCVLVPAFAARRQEPAPQKPAAPLVAAESQQATATPPPGTHALEKADLEAFFDGLVPMQKRLRLLGCEKEIAG